TGRGSRWSRPWGCWRRRSRRSPAAPAGRPGRGRDRQGDAKDEMNRGGCLMRFYWPIAKVDAEQRMVWGYASTEAEDDQGETVSRDALAAALDDYMRFANIREMHQPSAIGVAKEAAVDDKGLYLGAKIVDGDAWHKVVEGVYKGFSIGGRVTARDPGDRRLITALHLTEISVVDRPANPEAVFDCWKRSTGQ